MATGHESTEKECVWWNVTIPAPHTPYPTPTWVNEWVCFMVGVPRLHCCFVSTSFGCFPGSLCLGLFADCFFFFFEGFDWIKNVITLALSFKGFLCQCQWVIKHSFSTSAYFWPSLFSFFETQEKTRSPGVNRTPINYTIIVRVTNLVMWVKCKPECNTLMAKQFVRRVKTLRFD